MRWSLNTYSVVPSDFKYGTRSTSLMTSSDVVTAGIDCRHQSDEMDSLLRERIDLHAQIV